MVDWSCFSTADFSSLSLLRRSIAASISGFPAREALRARTALPWDSTEDDFSERD